MNDVSEETTTSAAAGDAGGLVSVVDQAIALVDKGDHRGALALLEGNVSSIARADHVRAATLFVDAAEARLGDKKRARRFVDDLLADGASTPELLRLSVALAGRAGDAAVALDGLGKIAALVDDSTEKARVWEEMGDLARDAKRPQDAIVHYQAAFRADRTAVGSIRKAARLYLDEGREELAKQLLDLEVEAATRGGGQVSSDLVDVYFEVADGLVTRPQAHGIARAAVDAALAIDPTREAAKKLRATLDEFPQKWKEHVRRLRDGALDARDKREAAKKYLSIAQIHREYAPDDAAQLQQNIDKCLLLAPGYRPALKFLEDIHRSGGRVGEFIEYLKKQVAGVRAVDVAVEMWLYIAVLMAEQGASPDQLAQAYESVRALDPRNLSAISALTELHLENGRFVDAARVMEDFLTETSDANAKRSTLRTLARIYEVEVGDLAKAAASLEALRALGGGHELLLSLVDLYARLSDDVKLASTLEHLAKSPVANKFEGGTVGLLERLYALYDGPLAQPERAFSAGTRLYALAPRDALEKELVRLADALARTTDLAEAYLAASQRADEATVKREQKLKAARAFVAGGDSKRARAVLTALLKENAKDKDALDLLDRILEREADPAELVEVLEGRLASEDDARARLRLLHSLADAYDRLRKSSEAIERLKSALEIDASDEPALEKLDALLKTEERYAELASIIERRVRVAADRQNASAGTALKRRLARLYDDRLDRGKDAARIYLEIYDEEPEDPDVVRALERLLDRGVSQVDIASALQPYYARVEAWRRQVEMIAIRRSAEEDPSRRATLARTSAEILEEKLRAPREAFDAWAACLLDEPTANDVVKSLERLSAAGLEARFAEVLAQAADKLPDGPAKNAMLSRRASLLQGVLGDERAAIEAHLVVLGKNPSHTPSLDALAKLYDARGAWRELADVLARRRALASGEEASQIAARLGIVLGERLQATSEAIEPLRAAVLGDAPLTGAARGDALRILAQCTRAQGATASEDLAEILPLLAEGLAGVDRARVRVELGDLLRERLGRPAEAIAAYDAALANDRQSAGALAGLRALLDDEATPVAVRQDAGRTLAARYESESNVAGRSHVLGVLLALETDRGARRRMVGELAELLTQESDLPEEALALLLDHLARDPADASAHERADALATAIGRPRDLLALYERLVEGADEAVARSARERVATLAERLGDLDVAMGAVRAMIAREPTRAESWERLRTLADRRGDAPVIAECLEQLANLTEGRAKVARLLVLADFCFEVLEDDTRGLDALRACRALAGDDDNILVRLATRLKELERFDELVEVMGARADQATQPGAAAALLAEQGALLMERSRPREAVAALTRALEIERDGNSTARVTDALQAIARRDDEAGLVALDAIVDHHRAQRAWQPLVESLEIAAQKRPAGAERAALYDEVSTLQEEAIRIPQLAFRAACLAFREEPTDERLNRVNVLASATASFQEAATVVEEAARALVATDAARAVRLFRGVIDVASRRLDDKAMQVRAAEAILAVDKSDAEALALLEGIHRTSEDEEQLIEVLKRRAEASDDATDRRNALLEMGHILMARNDETLAERAFRRILHEDGNDDEALLALDELYARTGNSAAHAEILERRIQRATGAERAEHWVRLGLLRLTRRGDPAGATDAFSAAVGESPATPVVRQGLEALVSHARAHGFPSVAVAAELLERAVRAQEDWNSVVPVMELRLQSEPSRAGRALFLVEMAAIQETKLQAPLMAFKTMCRALQEVPDDASIRAEAERLATATESEETLAIVYDDLLEQVSDPAVRVLLNRRMAEIAEAVGGDVDEARARLQAAVQAGAQDLDVLLNLTRLTRQGADAGEHASALIRLGGAAAAERDIATAKEAYFELCDVEENRGNVDGAIAAAKELLALDDADPQTRALIERLLTVAGRFGDLVTHLAQFARTSTTVDQRADTLARLVTVRLERIKDFEGAVSAVEELHDVAPAAESVVVLGARILLSLRAETGDQAPMWRARLAILLEPRYEAQGNHAALVEVLRLRLEVTSDPAVRKSLWQRIVDTSEKKLEQPQQAFFAISRALSEDPADKLTRDWAERISVKLGDLETLVALYEDIVEALPAGEPLRVVYAIRCGELYEGGIGDPSQAARFYEKALSLMSRDAGLAEREDVLDRLETLYRRMGVPANLALTLKRRAENRDPTTESELARQQLYEAATIQMHGLADFAGAIDTLKRLLKVAPHDLAALRALGESSERLQRWGDLADALDRELAAIGARDMQRALDIRFKVAVILDTHLDRASDADAHFAAILQAHPNHEPTRRHLAERLTKDGAFRAEGARFLEESYEATGDFGKAVDLLQQRLAEAERRGDRKEARDISVHIADIQESKLGVPDIAFMSLCRAVKHDPQDARLRDRLLALARANDVVDELCEVYEDEATAAEESGRGALAAELREQAARIYADEQGDLAKAITSYESILEKNPGRTAPLEELTRLYLQSGRFEDHERMVRRRLMFLDEAEDRVPLLMSLAVTVAEHLDRPSEAIPLIDEVRKLKPTHVEARRLLIALKDDDESTAELRALLEEELAHCREAGDTTALAGARRRLALLLSETLNDVDAAIPLWEEIRESAPDDRAAFLALESCYERAERWADLRTLLEAARAAERDPNRISVLEQKLGSILAEKLGGIDEAIERHLKVLEFDPRNATSLNALRQLYRSAGKYDELVALLRKMMRFTGDPRELKSLRFDLAEVVGERLDKRAEAVETGRRILDIEPHTSEELTRLAKVFRFNEAWEELADTLERAAALESGANRVEKLLELARVHEERLSRPEAAGPAYRGILEVDPGNDQAFDKLTAIYTKLLEWQQLVSLKETRLVTLTTHEARRDLLLEIGRVQEEMLAQKELAFLTACRAFREDYDDDRIPDWLDRLAIETDTVDEVLEVYDDALGHIGDDRRIVQTHLRMAELAYRQRDDIEQAELHFRRALEYDAKNTEALDRLVAMFEHKGKTGDAIGYLERKAEIVDDNAAKIEIYRRIGRTLHEHADDVEGAVAAFKRILELDGTDRAALRDLAGVYQRAGRWQALIGVLEREEGVVESTEEKLQLRYRAAGIWEQELNNADQAIATYRTILDEQPGNSLALKALERLFTSLSRPADLIEVFEKMIAHAPDVASRVRLLNKVASTWEESFENHEKAIAAFDRVLAIDAENVAALRSVERLARQVGAWERLIDALTRHIALSKDAGEIVKLYIEIGETYYRELGNTAKAEEYYTAALDHDPESREANSALGQLYERSGNWFNALEKLTNEAQIVGTEAEAVDLYYRIGKINEDMLLDVDSAHAAYERALEIDHTHLPSIQALKEIASRRGRHEEYLGHLRAEANYTEDDWGKTELHTTAGLFLQEKMSDLDGAASEFERALAVTFDHLPAAKPFAEIAFRNEQWERTESLLDIIVERLDAATEGTELCRQYYRLGYVCEKLGKESKALKSYQRAYELDATYLPALEGLGTALNKAGRYDDAAKIYQAILIHHRDGLTDAEVVDYYQQLATLNFKLGQNDRAKKNLEKALELDTAHAPSLRLLSDIHLNESRFEEAYETLMQLAPLLNSHDRVETLVEIGRLCRDKLEDGYRAIDAYEDANRQRPNDKNILEAMLTLYRDTRQGPRAIEILEELVRIEPDEKARVRLNNTLGEVYRDEIKNEGRALQYFNATLDLDPTYLRAFEAIERMLSASKNWKGLEENYIAMLRRIPDDRGGIKMVIWKNLGELYRYKLKNMDGAAAAYTVIHKADPDNVEILEVLAELLSRVPSRVDDAIAAYERLFPKAGDRQKTILHALVRLYLGQKLADRTYVATTVLKALRDLDADEQKLFTHYARAVPPRAKAQLPDKSFDALLVHEFAKGPLLEISAALWRGAGALFTLAPKDLELDKKRTFVQLEFDAPLPSLLVTQLKYVRQVFGAGAFDLYVKRGAADPIAPVPAQRPTLVVGEGNDVFREMPERQLWFTIGRQVTYLHPAFILPRALGPAKFQAVVDAAIRLVDPRYPAQGDAREVAEAGKQLTRAGAGLQQLLRAPVNEILKTKKPAPVATFLEGVEHTVNRAAHLLAADLEIAALVLRQPDPGVTSVPYGTKMRELVHFAMTPAHYALRAQLGVAIP